MWWRSGCGKPLRLRHELAPLSSAYQGALCGFTAAKPLLIPLESFSDISTNLSKETFTSYGAEPNHAGRLGGKSAWFSWKPPTNGIVTFDTRGSSFDTVLAAYTVTNTSFYPKASDDDAGAYKTSLIKFSVRSDETYKIAVDGNAGSNGVIVLNWDLEVTDDPFPRITKQPFDTVLLLVLTNNLVFGNTLFIDAIVPGYPARTAMSRWPMSMPSSSALVVTTPSTSPERSPCSTSRRRRGKYPPR